MVLQVASAPGERTNFLKTCGYTSTPDVKLASSEASPPSVGRVREGGDSNSCHPERTTISLIRRILAASHVGTSSEEAMVR